MAEPTEYSRSFGFADQQAVTPNSPLPGDMLDNELDQISEAAQSVAAALNDIRRADGALENGIVTPESLAGGEALQDGQVPVRSGETFVGSLTVSELAASAASAATSATAAAASAAAAASSAASLGPTIILRGAVATSAALPSSPTPDDGDAYLAEDTDDVWIWVDGAFVNFGPIQGPQGDQGEKGDTGEVSLAGAETLTNKTFGDATTFASHINFAGGRISALSSTSKMAIIPYVGSSLSEAKQIEWDGTDTWVVNAKLRATDDVEVRGDDKKIRLNDNSGAYQATLDLRGNVMDEDGVAKLNGTFGINIDDGTTHRTPVTWAYDSPSMVINDALRARVFGNTFNVLNYILEQDGGRAQVDYILAGNTEDQDATIVTAGVHAAVAAWYASSSDTAGGAIVAPFGAYRIDREIFDAVVSGTIVSKRIKDNGLPTNANGAKKSLFIDMGQAMFVCYADEWSSDAYTAGYFPDKAVFRWQPDTKQEGALNGDMPRFYWKGDYADRYKAPTAVKLRNLNLFSIDMGGASPRGSTWNWPGTGVHLDSLNNGQLFNLRVKAGSTPLAHEVIDTDAALADRKFDITTSGGRIEEGGALTRFTPPSGVTGADHFVGLYALVGDNAGTCNRQLVKVSSYISTSALALGTYTLDGDYADVNIGFQLPTCSFSDGGSTVTFDQPVVTSDMRGHLITVEGVRDNDASVGLMTAYVATTPDAYTCTLVGEGGVAATFGETASGRKAWLGGGVMMTQVYAASYDGKNDDVSIYGLFAEKCGGCQVLIQRCSGVHIYGSKGHGRDGIGDAAYELDFTRTGLAYAFDNVEGLELTGVKFSWASYIDTVRETVVMAKVYGDDNTIDVGFHEYYGAASHTTLFSLMDAGDDTHIHFSKLGEMRIDDWGDNGNVHQLADLDGTGAHTYANMISFGAPIKKKLTGSAEGFEDVTAPHKSRLMGVQNVTIASGAVAVSGELIRVDTEGAAASDDLDTINGGADGMRIVVRAASGSRSVTLTENGNITLPSSYSGSVLLNQKRDAVTLDYDAADNVWYAAHVEN